MQQAVCVSALLLRVLLVQQSDVCEGEVTSLAFTLPLPLAVHVDLGHLHHVSHLRAHTHTHTERERGRGGEWMRAKLDKLRAICLLSQCGHQSPAPEQ